MTNGDHMQDGTRPAHQAAGSSVNLSISPDGVAIDQRFAGSRYPRTCTLLASRGVDPQHIMGLDAEGISSRIPDPEFSGKLGEQMYLVEEVPGRVGRTKQYRQQVQTTPWPASISERDKASILATHREELAAWAARIQQAHDAGEANA